MPVENAFHFQIWDCFSSCELTVHSEEKISRSQTSLVQYTMYRLWKQSYLCHILWWFADVYCKMKCFVSIRFDLWHLLAHFLSWTRTLQAWISGPFFSESLTRERNRGISTNNCVTFDSACMESRKACWDNTFCFRLSYLKITEHFANVFQIDKCNVDCSVFPTTHFWIWNLLIDFSVTGEELFICLLLSSWALQMIRRADFLGTQAEVLHYPKSIELPCSGCNNFHNLCRNRLTVQ